MIEGVLTQKTIADGRIVTITPLTYARARITIGNDEETYEHGW